MSTIATRLEHDLLGDKAVPADAYYGVQTARALENFHISGVAASPVSQFDQGARDGEARRRARQRRLRAVQQGDPGRDRGRLPGDHRRQASRSVPARCVPGRCRHVDEHERERGDRESRARADGPSQGRVPALRPPRSRQLLAVDQRRLSFRAARRYGARQRRAGCGGQRAVARVPRQGQGVRRHSEDGPHATAGRRADDARSGVRRVRRRRSPAKRRRCSRFSACSAR